MAERFDFVVDTSPMAVSVNDISGHVNATTAAVVALEAAVIKSEKEAADEISAKVDRGFYDLIQSQISTKKATYFTEMNAKLALLIEFSKALSQSKTRMESDFFRLKREYYKIFHGLDKALENRIRQLDKNAMRIADIRANLISGHFIKDVAKTEVAVREISNTRQLALTARLKNKTEKALSSLQYKACENDSYKACMESVMDNKSIEQTRDEYVPVVYSYEQSMVMKESFVIKLTFPKFISDKSRSYMEVSIMEQMENIDKTPKGEKEIREIRDEFNNLVASSPIDERTASIMMKLFENGGV